MNAGILHQHRIKTRKCDQENLAGYWTLEFIDDESSLDIPVEKIVYYGLYNPTTNTLFSNSSELLTDINRTLLNLLSPEYCERATTIISTLRFNVRAMKRRAGWITTFHVIELRNLELAGVSFGEESEKYANVVAKISQIDKLIQNLNQIIATKERIVAQLEVSS